MAKVEMQSDPQVIEAEENLLIDFHYAIQEIMAEKNISRSQLAELAGLSKARLTQILSNEANPTVKSMARLFHALGERAQVSRCARELETQLLHRLPHHSLEEWEWKKSHTGEIRVDDQLVAVIKDTGASNDNYADRFVMVDSDLVAA